MHRAPGLKTEIAARRQQAAVALDAGLRNHTAITMASVKAENAFLKRRLHEREQDIATLKRRLGKLLGQAIADTAGPSEKDLEDRIAQLEQHLLEARETLHDRDEQLDAVRALNQRRLREHNREPSR